MGSRELDMTEYTGHTSSGRGGLAEQGGEKSLLKWPGLNWLFIQDRVNLTPTTHVSKYQFQLNCTSNYESL